jgi:hypothetical protein
MGQSLYAYVKYQLDAVMRHRDLPGKGEEM